MTNMGTVQGSGVQAVPLIVGVDTVYVHTNIEKIETDKEGNPVNDLFQYQEIQYGKDEYIQLMAEHTEQLEQQLTDTQLALCEIYEGMM